jgi:hypothetical protein
MRTRTHRTLQGRGRMFELVAGWKRLRTLPSLGYIVRYPIKAETSLKPVAPIEFPIYSLTRCNFF